MHIAAFNVPELPWGTQLVLDFTVLAQILVNDVTMWNDQRIALLNPDIPQLPSQVIQVLVQDDPELIQQLRTVLSAAVPTFADHVWTLLCAI